MIEVRAAESDADLEAFIRIRRPLLPNESGGTVALLRADLAANPDRHFSSPNSTARSSAAGSSASPISETASASRSACSRRPAAAELAPRCSASSSPMRPGDKVGTHLEEEESRPFAERFGFRETDRQVEQVKHLGDEPRSASLPDGIEVVTVAERP